MGLDNRGVWRGKCKKCKCEEFRKVNVRCECTHVPTAHETVENGDAAGPRDREQLYSIHAGASKKENNDLESPRVTTDDYQDFLPSSSKQSHCITCRGMYSTELDFCPYCPQELCKNPTCKKFKFTDAFYGCFDYCSPDCRDKDLLPEYNKKLEKDLNGGYSSYARSSSSSPIESDGKLPKSRSTPPLTRSALVINNSLTYAAAASQGSGHGGKCTMKCTKLFRAPAGIKPSPEPTNNAHTLKDHKSNTGTFYGGGTAGTQQKSCLGQQTRTVVPDLSNTHLRKTYWNEDNRTGLLVTGLTVGKETTWQWLDLITASVIPYKKFDNTMNSYDMVEYIKKSTLLEVYRDRDKDFKPIVDQIKMKVKNKDNMITFFILRQAEPKEYGLSQLDDEKLKVTPGSVAEECGIKDSDILQFFAVVHTTKVESFTLTKVVKKKDAIQDAFHKLKSSPNSVGLVLVVKRTGTRTLA